MIVRGLMTPRRPDAASSQFEARSGWRQRLAPLFQRLDEAVERVGERFDPFMLKLQGDRVDVDSDCLEVPHGLPRPLDRFRCVEGSVDAAMVFEGFERGWREGVDGIRSDQVLD